MAAQGSGRGGVEEFGGGALDDSGGEFGESLVVVAGVIAEKGDRLHAPRISVRRRIGRACTVRKPAWVAAGVSRPDYPVEHRQMSHGGIDGINSHPPVNDARMSRSWVAR